MRLTISLDDDLYRYVKARSKREDVSMSAVINALVRNTVEPVVEALPLLEVRNGFAVYPAPGGSAETSDEVRATEEEDDIESLRRAGMLP